MATYTGICHFCGKEFDEFEEVFFMAGSMLCEACFNGETDFEYDESVDESMNPYDGTYDWEGDVERF